MLHVSERRGLRLWKNKIDEVSFKPSKETELRIHVFYWNCVKNYNG